MGWGKFSFGLVFCLVFELFEFCCFDMVGCWGVVGCEIIFLGVCGRGDFMNFMVNRFEFFLLLNFN